MPNTTSNEKNNDRSAAEFVDQLASRTPTTEQSARESAGITRQPPDGRPSMIGVSDTDRAVPEHSRDDHSRDSTHRVDQHIQGEEVPTTGDHSERQVEKNHL